MPVIARLCFVFLCCVIAQGCKTSNTAPFLSSNNKDSIIAGAAMLTPDDTNGVRLIFVHADDPRITHKLWHYGQSMYQVKMNALKRISKLDPPAPITYKPDSEIIGFYIAWAVQSGYLDAGNLPGK